MGHVADCLTCPSMNTTVTRSAHRVLGLSENTVGHQTTNEPYVLPSISSSVASAPRDYAVTLAGCEETPSSS